MASPNVFFSFEGFNFESSDIFLFQKLYGLIDGLLIIVIYYQLQSHRGVDIRIAGKWTRPLCLGCLLRRNKVALVHTAASE